MTDLNSAWTVERWRRAVERLTELKLRYCRHLDTRSWPAFAALFSQRACMQLGETIEGAIEGPDAIVGFLRSELRSARTVHRVHPGEFRFEPDGSVVALWPMYDVVETPLYLLRGMGYYQERYVQEDGCWRIAHWRLLRTRIDFKAKFFLLSPILWLQRLGILRWIAPDVSRKITRTLTANFHAEDLL